MSAVEMNFPDPPPDKPSWLSLAQAVFNLQTTRWDTAHCGGGLRWQIYAFNKGYDYKNTISNGGFFQLAARLARYTNNGTYAEWAVKSWDWMRQSVIFTDNYEIYDGAFIADNCTKPSPYRWTYNVGTLLMGAANMYNYVCSFCYMHTSPKNYKPFFNLETDKRRPYMEDTYRPPPYQWLRHILPDP